MNDSEFYQRCAELLQTTHEGEGFRWGRRNRWNNRTAGRGRFPGCGIIRIFGDQVHVALTEPKLSMTGTMEEVLARLNALN